MSCIRRVSRHILALALSWLVTPHPAMAQEPLEQLRRELASLRSEVEQLRAQVEALKSASGGAPISAPAVEILQTQVAELAQTKVESTSRLPVKVFGTIHAGAFANSANPNWLDIPNLVAAPPADGSAGTMSASLRQTRIGLTVDGPSLGSARTSAVVAMDFFGGIPGFQTGQVMGLPRLLVGYARIDGKRTAVEIGQDHMIVAPRDPTSLAAFAFPLLFRSGNLYLRVPQARVERSFTSHVRATAGIVAPVGGDLTGDAYVFVPPALAGERSMRPGFQARLAYAVGEADARRNIEAGVSGHVGWERRGANLTEGWAGAVDLRARRDRVGVAGEAFAGNNIDAFGGGLGLDARTAGGWGEVQLFPSDRVTFAAGYGTDDLRDTRRFTLPRRRNRSAYGNVIFSLTPEVQASFEYRWLSTLAGTTDRPNHHFDWVLVHKF
jgi:hypothetical protein